MGWIHHVKQWVETAFGVHIYRTTLPWGSNLHHDLSRSGIWPNNPVIVDVGAHLGETALEFLNANPSCMVHSFEPASENFIHLQSKLKSWHNANAWKIAISNWEGKAPLHIKSASTTHSLVNARDSSASELVEVQTLDAFCRRRSIEHIHFLKVDAEGADIEVLKGAETLLNGCHVDFIQVETSMRKDIKWFARFEDVGKFMAAHGFELFGFYDQQQCWSGRQSLLYLNAVYVRVSMIDLRPVG